MAHELVHLIQNSRRFSDHLGYMGTAMAEAQAVLGEEVVGNAVTGRRPYQNYGYDVAFNATGQDAVDWYAEQAGDLFRYFGLGTGGQPVADAPAACGWWQQDPSPCRSRPLWYGVGWSFLRWLSDTFGPTYPGGEAGLQRALLSQSGSGPELAADVVGVPLGKLMAQWSASLYTDDRLPGAQSGLGFSSWNLRDFEQHANPAASLQPLETPFGSWTRRTDVRASSTAYVAVEGAGRVATAIRVRDASGGELPSYMQVWVVRMQ
jgi:hypothetical protein